MKRQSLVIWNDAKASLDEYRTSEVEAFHRPTVVHTYGYIVKKDDSGITIAAEWIPARDGDEDTYRSVSFIPAGMVIEVRPSRRRKKPEPATT